MKKVILLFSCFWLLIGCQESSEKRVMNLEIATDLKKVKELNLDENHANLLNTRTSSKEEQQEVMSSWKNFHQQVGDILKEEKFSWGIGDSNVTMVNKVYFNKNGNVTYYMFRVINESVSLEKRKEFENIMMNHIDNIRIDLQRDTQFSQCGKVKYQNL